MDSSAARAAADALGRAWTSVGVEALPDVIPGRVRRQLDRALELAFLELRRRGQEAPLDVRGIGRDVAHIRHVKLALHHLIIAPYPARAYCEARLAQGEAAELVDPTPHHIVDDLCVL